MKLLFLPLITIFGLHGKAQNTNCDKLVSLFIDSKDTVLQMLENQQWKMYDSVNYNRTNTTKTEHRLFYKKAIDGKKVDSLVYIYFTDKRFPFYDTAVTGRSTIVQYKTTSQKNFKLINDGLLLTAKLLFDTTTNKGIYHFYEYKKVVVKIVKSTDVRKPIYLFWVISKYAFDVSRPSPPLKKESNIFASPVESRGTGVPLPKRHPHP